MTYTTALPLPIKGRLPLVEQTVLRFKLKNQIDHVVIIASSTEDMEFSEMIAARYAGVDVIFHPNQPLGLKWGYGFNYLMREYDPDYYIYAGSSDWVSSNWTTDMILRMQPCSEERTTDSGYVIQGKPEPVDLIGKLTFDLFDVGQPKLVETPLTMRMGIPKREPVYKTTTRFAHWHGYEDKQRKGESIGSGRILSKRLLHLMDGFPFHESLNSSLDYSMQQKAIYLGGKIKTVSDTCQGASELKNVSLSFAAWRNLHLFDQHWSGKLPSTQMGDGLEYMNAEFPEWKAVCENLK